MSKTKLAVPPPVPVEDREAVRRCVAGDERAAQVIYHRYRREVEGVFSAQGAVRGADVSDFSQSVFLKVFRNLRGFAGTSLRPWIRQIAFNEKNNLLRQLILERGRRGEASAPLDELPGPGGIDPVLLIHAKAWIARLPTEFRRTVELYLLGGLSHEEIAAALRIPEGTVKSRIHRAVALSEPRARRAPRALLLLGWLAGARRALALKPWALLPAATCLGVVFFDARPPAPGPALRDEAVAQAPARRSPRRRPAAELPPDILPTYVAAVRPLPLPFSTRPGHVLAAARGEARPRPEPRWLEPRWLEPVPAFFTRPPDPPPPARPALRAADLFSLRGPVAGPDAPGRIELLERLVAVTSEADPELPELRFRLAELYAGEGRRLAAETRAVAAARRAEREDLGRRERAALLAEVRQYLEIAADPVAAVAYPRMDRVLLRLAVLLRQEGKEDQAQGYFKRLIQDHPQSPLLPHAYLSFAEHAYEARDLESALKLYDKVLKYPGSPAFGLALYKRGWVSYDIADYRGALGSFAAALEHAAERGDEALGRAARRDLVRAYAHIGDPEKARPFFEKYGGAHALPMLEELAARYGATGQFAGSVKAYRELVRLQPELSRLCGFQREILRATLALGGGRATAEAVTELDRLQAVWARTEAARDLPRPVVQECREAAQTALRELAFVWQREAQRTGDGETFGHAESAYRAYLRIAPDQRAGT